MAKSGSLSHKDVEQMSRSPINRNTLDNEKRNQLLKEVSKPVEINSLQEIKQLISIVMQSDSNNSEIILDTKLEWVDDEGNRQEGKITAKTKDLSIYKLLIDGLDVVKNYMQSVDTIKKAVEKVEDKDDIPANILAVWNIERMHFNVDSFIEKKFGGKRSGLRIRWNLKDGIYEWDPYMMKLYKVEDENAESTTDKNPR